MKVKSTVANTSLIKSFFPTLSLLVASFSFVLCVAPDAAPADESAWIEESEISENVLPLINGELILQPAKGALITIDNKPYLTAPFKIDKSLYHYKINAPVGKKVNVKITLEGHRPFESVAEVTTLKQSGGRIGFVHLTSETSGYDFISAYRVCVQPKSAMYISPSRVVFPCLDDKGIDVIDLKSRAVHRIIPSEESAKHKGYVESLFIPEHGLFAVSQMTQASLHLFNIKTLTPVESIPVKARWSKVMFYDSRRDRIYLSNWSSKDITIINLKTRKSEGSIPVYGVPRGMALDANADHLWVALFGKNNDEDGLGQVVKINLETGKLAGTYGSPSSKRHILYDKLTDRMIVSDMGRSFIEFYQADTGKLEKKIKVFEKPNTLAFDANHGLLYVSCRGPNNPKSYLIPGFVLGRIYVIDTKSQEIVEWWESGNQPTGLDVSKDGSMIVATDFLDNVVRIYKRR